MMQRCKPFERPVKGLLDIPRERAGGKFPRFKMILDAFAADALPRTGVISAGTAFFVLFFFAFHMICLA